MKLIMCTKPGINDAAALQSRQIVNRMENRDANELFEFIPSFPSMISEDGDTSSGIVTNTTKAIASRTDVGSHDSGSSWRISP